MAYEYLSSVSTGHSFPTLGPPYSRILNNVCGIPYIFNNVLTAVSVPLVFNMYGKLFTIRLHTSPVICSSLIEYKLPELAIDPD
jgi:hypothetical protein